MVLSNDDDPKPPLSIRNSMDGKGVFGTLIIGGEQFKQLSGFFFKGVLSTTSYRSKMLDLEKGGGQELL